MALLSHLEHSPCIFLTGATGFLGKVVLSELFRRREELQFNKIIVSIRSKQGQDSRSRFFKELVSSPCFANLPVEWTQSVQVVGGDLREKSCGISKTTYEKLRSIITHIIHCAGSVRFDLPLAESATSNITSALNVYDFAQSCPKLQQLVITSTAYVTPHTSAPMYEILAPLPQPAVELFKDIQEGTLNEKAILRTTGHPNTYTLTKSIAEHLIMERGGGVPITIIRPSIISASMKYPFPGWIDSSTTIAAFVIARGTGVLRVLDGNLKVVLDVVPVDQVARLLIDQALLKNRATSFSRILYAVATLKNGMNIGAIKYGIEEFFDRKQERSRIRRYGYWGPRNLSFYIHDFVLHKIRFFFANLYYALRGSETMRRRIKGASKLICGINGLFPYFVNHTFDFRPKIVVIEDFDVSQYLELVCSGVEKHLMSKYY